MNLQSSTLKDDESGEPLHVQQRKQIEAYREAWKEAGHRRRAARVGQPQHLRARRRAATARTSDATTRDHDQIGYIDANTRAIFGRSYAAEPDVLVKELARGRGDRRRRHAAPDGAEHARRGLQRARDREHPQVRRTGARLALTSLALVASNPPAHGASLSPATKKNHDSSAASRRRLQEAGIRVVLIPERAPNANAYAERIVRSIKAECLARLSPIGERHFRRAVAEYIEHYYGERNHQGLDNRLISGPPIIDMTRRVRRRQRLGGLLNFYERAA